MLGNPQQCVCQSDELVFSCKSIVRAIILFVSFFIFFPILASFAQDVQVTLSSLQLKACIVAYNDFDNKINVQVSGPPALVAHISNIDNYVVTVSEDEANYMIMFLPNPFAGQTLKGAGARYTISKANFHIKDMIRFK